LLEECNARLTDPDKQTYIFRVRYRKGEVYERRFNFRRSAHIVGPDNMYVHE
jgi:hypothetical protein